MIKIRNFIILFCIVLFSTSCSFKNPGNFFKNKEDQLKKEILIKNTKLVFETQKKFNEEISGTINAKIPKIISKNWLQTNFSSDNFTPHFEYENKKYLIKYVCVLCLECAKGVCDAFIREL